MGEKIKLNDGNYIPVLGLGVYQSGPGEETYSAVLSALKVGYRHVDTATLYKNEADVGRAIRDSGIPREEIFVTTKLWNSDHEHSEQALEHSLKLLGLSYVDLYLIHSPGTSHRLAAWDGLVRGKERGLAKSIGVSNYGVHHLEELFKHSPVKPAVNQVELHPYNTRTDIVNFCAKHNIVVEAYSPLTRGQRLKDPKLIAIAKKYNRSTAQTLLRWSIQKGYVVLAKSVSKERQIENFSIFDYSISPEDMATLDSFDEYLVTGWDPTRSD